MEYPRKRNLDGCYFRVERNGKYEDVCFTDLTEEEQAKFIQGRSAEWLTSLVMHFGKIIRMLGDALDLEYEDDEG